MTEPRWFQGRPTAHSTWSPTSRPSSASPRRCRSTRGGLGVLAGDHLKAASDLGVPLVAHRPALRRGLLPPEAQRRRLPGGALPPPRPTRPGADADRRAGVGRHGRRRSPGSTCGRSTVGRINLYLLDTAVDGNSPEVAAITDRLYGGDIEHRLRQEIVLGIGGVRALRALGLQPAGVPHQRGPRRLPLARAHPRAGRVRADVRRGDRGRSRRRRVHDAHSGAGRHRPLPARADGEVLRHVRRVSCGVDVRRADGGRPSPRRARRRSVQHGGDGSAPRRPQQRRRPAARRGQPRDVPGHVARRPRRRGADRLDHQRRARPHLGQRRRSTVCWPAASARCGTAPTRHRGPASPSSRPRGVWATRAKGRADLVVVRPHSRSATPCSTRRADDRLRPPLRDVQAGHAAALPARPPAPPAARRQPAGAVRVRRQGPPGRPARQGHDPRDRDASPATSTSATASCSCPTTTWPSPAPCTTAATCGSTTRAARSRRAAPAG